jgi:hypothetical protein
MKLISNQAICVYVFAYFSDKLKIRSAFILLGLAMCLIGFIINISNVDNGVKYFGIYLCVAGSYAAFPGVVAWYGHFLSGNGLESHTVGYRLGNNLAGQYKRGIGMSIHIGIGNFSGAIASNIYLAKDSPRFRLGRTLNLSQTHTYLTDTNVQMGSS